MTKWEYQTISDLQPHEIDTVLNSHGEQGWECFAVKPYMLVDVHGTPTHYVHAFLKRQAVDDIKKLIDEAAVDLADVIERLVDR